MTERGLIECRERLKSFAGQLLQEAMRVERQRYWAEVYMRGLLLEGRRKSCQPMAQRMPDGDEQSLQQFLNQSTWRHESLRAAIARQMVAQLGGKGAWVIDATGFVKQGKHSVGVARQYCPPLGKRANCQIGVSVSYASSRGAQPLDWRLYLPEAWAQDRERRAKAGVPEEVVFAPKWQLALDMIDELRSWGVPDPYIVLADADFGAVGPFRAGLSKRRLRYVLQVRCDLSVRVGLGAPQSVEQLARSLPQEAWAQVTWREGSKGPMSSRFARVRVRVTNGPEQRPVWLLIEWPTDSECPTKYWISNLSARVRLDKLVYWAKGRWPVEIGYREQKDHLGLDHFEGRGWVGWHHHVTMVMLAHAFILSERLRQAQKGGDPYQAFPRSWVGSSSCWAPGAESVLSANSLSHCPQSLTVPCV